MLNLKKFLPMIAAGTALAASFGPGASAAPVFTIDPSGLGISGAPAPFQADFITGTSSELLTITGNTASGSGWVQFGNFALNNVNLFSNTTGLGSKYNLYLTFQLSDTLSSGAPASPGSTYTLNTLDFQLFADPGLNTGFTAANAATSTNASIGGTTSDDIFLGRGSLISGTAGFDTLFGAFLNSLEAFEVCTGAGAGAVGNTSVPDPQCTSGAGNAFFADPHPFYSFAFDEFNNTTQGVSKNGNLISINQATGGVDFAVPEPTSLALLGTGLVALGFASRRRRTA